MSSELILIVGAGVLGLAVSPIVLMLIARGPEKAPFFAPLTRCASTPHRGAGKSLVPLLGRRLSGGKCAGCNAPLPAWQPIVEVAHAALWMLAVWHFGMSLELVVMLPFFSGLLALSVIDLLTYRLPDRLNLPLLIYVAGAITIICVVRGDYSALLDAVIGGVGFWLVLAAMWFVYPKGMGYGDVKMARSLGLVLGWVHVMLPIYGLMFAGIGGSVAGIAMVIITRDRAKGFPFGPWLASGTMLAIMLAGRLTQGF